MNARILLGVGLLLLLSGCSDEQLNEKGIKEREAIGFQVYNSLSSRGVPINGNQSFDTEGRKFGVTAYYHNLKYMDNTQIQHSSASTSNSWASVNNSQWGYADISELAFWPEQLDKNHALAFYAYYPSFDNHESRSSSSESEYLFPSDTYQSKPGIWYTVSTNHDDQSDFLYASAFIDHTEGDNLNGGKLGARPSDNTVNLNFRHGLCQVRFSVRVAQRNMVAIIDKDGITVHNISNQAKFQFPEAENITKDGTWSDFNTTKVDFVNPSTSNLLINYTDNLAQYTPINEEDKTLLLLPQQLSGLSNPSNQLNTNPITFNPENEDGAYLSIRLKLLKVLGGASYTDSQNIDPSNVYYYLGNTHTYSEIFIPLSTGSKPTTWRQGEIYNYRITLNGNNLLQPIHFQVSTSDWNTTKI